MTDITVGNHEEWADTTPGYARSEFDRYTGTIRIYEGADGQWYWRLTALNGEIVGSGEGYTRKGDAIRGWAAAQKAATNPKVDLHLSGDDR